MPEAEDQDRPRTPYGIDLFLDGLRHDITGAAS